MTIMELLEWGNKQLRRQPQTDPLTGERLDSPILDSEILLAAALKQPKAYLFSHLNDVVAPEQADRFRAYLKRRLKHEPVAYITGKKAFYRRDFAVNQYTLIPRPETETLVEEAIRLAEAFAGETWFTDIGVGSGAIAVTLSAETGRPVIATDISARTLTVAKQNAVRHRVDELIDFKKGSGFEPVAKLLAKLQPQQLLPQQLIVCANLPYLTTEQWEQAQPEIVRYEPRDALVAGADGLDAYWLLFRQLSGARTVLPERTEVLAEIDPAQAAAMPELIQHCFPNSRPKIKQDLGGLDRVVVARIK